MVTAAMTGYMIVSVILLLNMVRTDPTSKLEREISVSFFRRGPRKLDPIARKE